LGSLFFDDTSFSEGADSYIGLALLNEAEATGVSRLSNKLNDILNIYGNDHSDNFYLSTPEWMDVIQIANELLALFGE
jgi:hypothetical protein